ncbi:MAG: glutamine--tRNA ligase/YqeY domain fusion protein [Dehalococcoidales bacterium]|nr:glutamine--tRNA ligase/YqeY domain fusion protein [Dehalococcoidales bacterium]
MNTDNVKKQEDFIRDIVRQDIETGKFGGKVNTRFPPEPNGLLHIGHAKAIWISYALAEEYGGYHNLRFDDTNPITEKQEFVDAIIKDIEWLGWNIKDRIFYASDYFEQMYEYAVQLIKKGKAYVDDSSAEEISKNRGDFTTPGKHSPYRDRSIEENLDLFERMRNGEFPDGAKVLRAKIDMSASNMNMRDPLMYRIQHATHMHAGDKWCIYPMYDWAHGLEDSIEGVTYSLCSLEFKDHRPLYDWFLDELGIFHPQQIEFGRYSLTYTVVSKRVLGPLVDTGFVSGWDDPRMPTLSGLRRHGYTPEALKLYCESSGISEANTIIDINFLEHCLREDLNKRAPRVMGVLRPLRLVIDNYPDDQVEEFDAVNNPEDHAAGTRKVSFSKVLYIEQEDFMEVPAPKYYRLSPGREVRLRYAYLITCVGVEKNDKGEVVEVHCTYDPATRGGDAPDGRKVQSTMHWVSAKHAVEAEVRLYDHLFTKENPMDVEEGADYKDYLNPNSLEILKSCRLEPSLADAKPGDFFQFERMGYFCVDPDTAPGKPVFNRTITLRDTWAKIQKQQK